MYPFRDMILGPLLAALLAAGIAPARAEDAGELSQALVAASQRDWATAEARAKVRGVAAIIGCDIHPLQNLRVLRDERTIVEARAAADAYVRSVAGRNPATEIAEAKRLLDAGVALLGTLG